MYLINIDPNGMDCIYINNDTGAYEGFDRADCDNSTDAKANTGPRGTDGTFTHIPDTIPFERGTNKYY